IACQWAKALGVKLIGTVSSPEKAELAMKNGSWKTIDYSRENIVERVMDLTGGKKVPVVYDGVGKDTWEASLDCIEPRGLMVSFGNASGPVTGVNVGILSQKGSLYLTRPTLGTHIGTPEKLKAASDELFDLVLKKKIKIAIAQRYPLARAGEAQTALAARKTVGATVLTLD
ncbi:MAG TPA: zinc-binding dehydrogenase, partial [Bordetella sp.]|uniref:zinc-binding dehydrogenase n=1 Tax=Bordetella sp. TaxID=28081 RepID=UPI002ED217BB